METEKKTPEEIAQEQRLANLANPEGKAVPKPEGQEGADDGTGDGDGGTDFTPTYANAWSHLKDTFGVEVPDDLNAENEVQVLTDTVTKLQKPDAPQLHPVAAELNQKLADPEFKMEEWINQRAEAINIHNLSGEDFFKKVVPMKFPDASEEDIATTIEQLANSPTSKLTEMEMKQELKNLEAQQRTQIQQQQTDRLKAQILESNKVVEKELGSLFERTSKVEDIFGLPISEADRQSFNQVFKELALQDPETGKIPLYDLLQSDDDLWQFAYMKLYGNEEFKSALSEAKEGTKASIFGKLKPKPFDDNMKKPSGGGPGAKKPDYKKFAAPEGRG